MPGGLDATIKVSTSTLDLLKELADADGLTLDAELQVLVRRERQRRMGRELAAVDLDQAEAAWEETGASEAGDPRR